MVSCECVCVCVCHTVELAAIAPSTEGDLSAGHSAAVRSLATRVSEALRAENAFLACVDTSEVSTRLRALAAAHAARWSEEDPAVRGAARSAGGSLSAAAAQDALKPVHLDVSRVYTHTHTHT